MTSIYQDLINKYLYFNYDEIPRSVILENVTAPSGQIISIHNYINVIKGNTYTRNFGGLNQGLVDVTGIFSLTILDETFTQNGENMVEITNYMW